MLAQDTCECVQGRFCDDGALRENLDQSAQAAVSFLCIAYGNPNQCVQHEPMDFAAVSDAEDRERLRG